MVFVVKFPCTWRILLKTSESKDDAWQSVKPVAQKYIRVLISVFCTHFGAIWCKLGTTQRWKDHQDNHSAHRRLL